MISSTLALTDLGSAVSYIKSIPGLGFMTAVTLVAELGSANRFKNGKQAAASCGLTPKLKGSGGVTLAGRITKHGSKVARRAVYAATKAVIRFSEEHQLFYKRIKARRGGKRALVALSKKLVVQAWTTWVKGDMYRPSAA
jgi:transposase